VFDESIRGKGIFTKLLSDLEGFCKARSMNITIDTVIKYETERISCQKGIWSCWKAIKVGRKERKKMIRYISGKNISNLN
jgi:hypothetical protein